jgi:hypothetical protein
MGIFLPSVNAFFSLHPVPTSMDRETAGEIPGQPPHAKIIPEHYDD